MAVSDLMTVSLEELGTTEKTKEVHHQKSMRRQHADIRARRLNGGDSITNRECPLLTLQRTTMPWLGTCISIASGII